MTIKILPRLTASPEYWRPDEKEKNFGFDDFKTNAKEAKKFSFLLKNNLIETTQDGSFLVSNPKSMFSSQGGQSHELALIRKISLIGKSGTYWKLDYYLRYREYHWHDLHIIIQTKIWGKGLAPIGYPSHVFYDFLFPKCDAIMADWLESKDMERFWIRQIREAFNKKFHVYFINLETEEKILVSNLDEFTSLLDFKKPWEDGEEFRERRLLISKKLLKF